MSKQVKSHVGKNGSTFYKNAGGFNEHTKAAKGTNDNHASSALHQKNLVISKGSAAASTVKMALAELRR